MSGWLRAGISVLEGLDGAAENVADLTASLTARRVNNQQEDEYDDSNDDDDDDDDDDYESYDDDEEEDEEGSYDEEDEEEGDDGDDEDEEEEEEEEVILEPPSASKDPLFSATPNSGDILEGVVAAAGALVEETISDSNTADDADKSNTSTASSAAAATTAATAALVQQKSISDNSKKTAPPSPTPPYPPPTPVNKQPQKGNATNAKKKVLSSKMSSSSLASNTCNTVSGKNTNNNNSNTSNNKQEVQRLQKENRILKQQLQATQYELQAAQKELHQAADRIQEDEELAKEDLHELQQQHAEEIQALHQQYKLQLLEEKEKYQILQQTRQREGGDATKELQQALERERIAIQQFDMADIQRLELKSQNDTLQQELNQFQATVERLTFNIQAMEERERLAESRLDTTNALHQKQIIQRQAREAELENTIAQLSSAAAAAASTVAINSAANNNTNVASSGGANGINTTTSNSNSINDEIISFKDKYEMTMEELETSRTQLELLQQRCTALQDELNDISNERTMETATWLTRQGQLDEQIIQYTNKITQLTATIQELQMVTDGTDNNSDHDFLSTLETLSLENNNDMNNNGTTASANSSSSLHNVRMIQRLQREVEQNRHQITLLSDQLMRQQGINEVAKSEILALKGRLQAAVSRAEIAETAAAAAAASNNNSNNPYHHFEMESGGGGNLTVAIPGSKMRRRVRGRHGHQHHLSTGSGGRTLRSALGLRGFLDHHHHHHDSSSSSGGGGGSRANRVFMDHVAQTVDAVDMAMLETGAILRHEPWARLGFAAYLTLLHLWCFGLVAFHTVQSEHGDLGALTAHRAVLGGDFHHLTSTSVA